MEYPARKGASQVKPLFKKGDVVTVFQMDVRKGLLIEGRATVLKPLSANDWPDEYYHVRFHGKNGKPSLGEEYDRFIDRDGQTDPDQYVCDFNRRLGIGKDGS
jgi:hypothetical protein